MEAWWRARGESASHCAEHRKQAALQALIYFLPAGIALAVAALLGALFSHDHDKDGDIDMQDAFKILDLDGDGDIDMQDALKVGDLNGDGVTSSQEFAAVTTGSAAFLTICILGFFLVAAFLMRKRLASRLRLGCHTMLEHFTDEALSASVAATTNAEDTCLAIRYTFTQEALGQLQIFYKEHVRAIPGFLSATLFNREIFKPLLEWSSCGGSSDLQLFSKEPQLFVLEEICLDNDRRQYFLLMLPNMPRAFKSNKLKYLCSQDSKKRARAKEGDGLSFTAWAIHPEVQSGHYFKETSDSDEPVTPSAMTFGASSSEPRSYSASACEKPQPPRRQATAVFDQVVGEDLEGEKKKLRKKSMEIIRSTHKTCREIEDGAASRTEYLVTILDLTPLHLPFLEKMRSAGKAHMADYYDYKPETDSLLMYFHFPTQDVSSTLHMHVTVNSAMSDSERARSFFLDPIIEHLRTHNNVFGLILERQTDVDLSTPQRGPGLCYDARVDVVDKFNDEKPGLVKIEKGYLCGNMFYDGEPKA